MPKVKTQIICDDCEQLTNSYIKNANDENLCTDCGQKDVHIYICKTNIKKDYFLTDKDLLLANLDIIDVKNPKYNSGARMNLFKKSDITDLFCEKYSVTHEEIQDQIIKLHELKEAKKKRTLENKAGKVVSKTTILENALKKYKLDMRSDSKLCSGFIDGSIKDWTVDQVVHRMCQMKYLFDYCDMDDCFEEAKTRRQEEYDAGYFPDMPLFDEAEQIALKNAGGYPQVFPWMK